MDDGLFEDIAALAATSGLQDPVSTYNNCMINESFADIEEAVSTSLSSEVPGAKRFKTESVANGANLQTTIPVGIVNGMNPVEGEKPSWSVEQLCNGNSDSRQAEVELQDCFKAEPVATADSSGETKSVDVADGQNRQLNKDAEGEESKKEDKGNGKEAKKEEEDDGEGGGNDDSKKRKRKKGGGPINLRKNIRDIYTDDKLESETLAAQQAEMERKRRLQEIQQRAHQEMLAQQMLLRQQEHHLISSGLLRRDMHPMMGNSLRNSNYSMLPPSEPHVNFRRSEDIIIVESSSNSSSESGGEDDKSKMKCVIAISSSDDDTSLDSDDDDDDDDIVAVSSTPSDEEETKAEDPHNSGSHVNDNFNMPDAQGRILVNVGHPADDPDIFLAPHLAKVVKPHQVGGIRFLYDNIVESLASYKTSNGFGCILAHSMGLGKTLQVISFVDVLIRHTEARTILIIVPINTIANWVSEFNMWTPLPPSSEAPNSSSTNSSSRAGERSGHDGQTADVQNQKPQSKLDGTEIRYRNFSVIALGDAHKTNPARAKAIRDWMKDGGVLLMGYEMYRIILSKKRSTVKFKRGRKAVGKPSPKEVSMFISDLEEDERNKELILEMQQDLQRPDLVICDEGHRIKNCHASTSQALKSIKTKRRVVLTGYPLQNNLIEYWCMVDFVRPSFLGTRTEFCNMFERPIQNGQCVDSTPEDIRLMRYRAHVLHSLLEGFVQRRGHSVLRTCLPQKYEHVLLVRLTPVQRLLYNTFMTELQHRNAITNPIKAFSVCCKIWNHPDVLYNCMKNHQTKGLEDDLDLEEAKLGATAANNTTKFKKRGTSKGAFAGVGQSRSGAGDAGIPVPSTAMVVSAAENGAAHLEQDIGFMPFKDKLDANSIHYEWANGCLNEYRPGVINNGLKMVLTLQILEQSILVGDRLLLFSQSLFTLSLIEEFLAQLPVPFSNGVKWTKNKNYFRLDGSTSSMDREKFVNEFNSNPNILLFLISTRAGSLGINLIGANRVIVFDASWNPCHDTQAVCRIYRYGQTKPCHVYRLVTDNTLEKKIYDRQINKQGMSDRVVDELSPDVTLTMKEVSNLLCINESDPSPQDLKHLADKYDDHVLGYVCLHLGHFLTRHPFEHESQLMDRKELKLTKTEKRLAKQSYEMDKKATVQFGRSSYYGHSRSEPFGSMDMNYSGRPVANVRPMQSTAPRPSPLDVLAKQGVTFRQIHLTKEVQIPQPDGQGEPIVIPAGQQVMIISSPRGIFLRCPNNKLVQISHPTDAMGRNSGIDSCNLMMQNRYHNNSLSHLHPQNHLGPNETEVIDLSDDDEDDDVIVTTPPSFPPSRSVIVSPGSNTYTSQNPGLLTGGMVMRNQLPAPAPTVSATPRSSASSVFVRPMLSTATSNPSASLGSLPPGYDDTGSINLTDLLTCPNKDNPVNTLVGSSACVGSVAAGSPMITAFANHQIPASQPPPSSASSSSSSSSASQHNSELPTSAMDYLNKTLSTPSYSSYPPWGSSMSTWGNSYVQGQSPAADQVAFVSSIRDLLLPSAPRLFPASTALPELVTAQLSAQHLGALYPHVLDVANDTPSYHGSNATSNAPPSVGFNLN